MDLYSSRAGRGGGLVADRTRTDQRRRRLAVVVVVVVCVSCVGLVSCSVAGFG